MPKSANVSTKAKAKGSSKIGGTSGGSGWSQPWSRAQALAETWVNTVQYVFVILKIFKQNTYTKNFYSNILSLDI